jgi:hypothetical protein
MNFVSITQIILTANNLTSINFFYELKLSFSNQINQIQSLILSRNKITNIELSELLIAMPNLKELDISQNFIEVFQSD